MEPTPPTPGKPDKSPGLGKEFDALCSLGAASWALPMASPRQSWGLRPLDPPNIAARQPKMMLSGEREGAAATAPGPAARVAAAASGLRCKAVLVLAVCLFATVLPYSLGALAAPIQGSLAPSHAQLGSPASWRGTSDDVVATRGDLLSQPEVHQDGGMLVGFAGAPGCCPGVADVSSGANDKGQSLGTPMVATARSRSGQKREVSPSPGLPGNEDPAAASPLVSLPSERVLSLPETQPGTARVPSAVTAEMIWGTQPAGTSLHGQAALLVDTGLAKVPENRSGLLAPVWVSPPSATSAHAVNHPQEPAAFLPAEEAGGPAVTLGMRSGPSSSPARGTLLTPTEAPTSPSWTRAPSAAGPAGTGVSWTAPTAEPRATGVPREDGAAMVASSPPRAAGVTHGSSLGSPAQRPPLRPDPLLPTAPGDGPTVGQHRTMAVAEMGVLPGTAAVTAAAAHSKPRTAPVGPPAGPPHASPSSAPPPSSQSPAPEHQSEAEHHASTLGSSSPSYVLTPGAVHAASSLVSSQSLDAPTGVTPDAWSTSSCSVPTTATERLPAATGETFTPAEQLLSKPGVKPLASHAPGLPSPAQPPHVLPLRFRLLGIAYTAALRNSSSGSYRQLEEEVRLLLNQVLSFYETFLQANVLEFLNGSVVVRGEALFRGDEPAPTSSHLIRTLVAEASRGRRPFSWQLEPRSVQSGGFSLENLDPEKLSFSLTALQLGSSRTEALEGLISEVTRCLSDHYHVRNVTATQLRDLHGHLEIAGDIYLDAIVHADVAEVLQALTALASSSVDLLSLSVEGTGLHLQVYPFSFLITNRHFSENLQDPLAPEHQELARDLGDAVARALRDHRSFLQLLIREFLPGSLICHGDLVFQHPAPTSLEVLETLVLSVGSNKSLAGSDLQVDPYSLAVGEDALEPPLPQPGLPEYGVAIVIVCGLCIIAAPIVLLVCLRNKRLGWRDVVVLWDRRDPEAGTQNLEMENRGFWTASEQGTEVVQMQSDSA